MIVLEKKKNNKSILKKCNLIKKIIGKNSVKNKQSFIRFPFVVVKPSPNSHSNMKIVANRSYKKFLFRSNNKMEIQGDLDYLSENKQYLRNFRKKRNTKKHFCRKTGKFGCEKQNEMQRNENYLILNQVS